MIVKYTIAITYDYYSKTSACKFILKSQWQTGAGIFKSKQL